MIDFSKIGKSNQEADKKKKKKKVSIVMWHKKEPSSQVNKVTDNKLAISSVYNWHCLLVVFAFNSAFKRNSIFVVVVCKFAGIITWKEEGERYENEYKAYLAGFFYSSVLLY